jgi:hypothetical protein
MPCVKLASNTGTLKWLRQGPLSLVSCLTAALALLYGVAPSRAQKVFVGTAGDMQRRCSRYGGSRPASPANYNLAVHGLK